jgi:hypothetical protein
MEDEEKQIRYELNKSFLRIPKWSPYIGPLMHDYVDSFVELSRDNTSVQTVELYLFDSSGNYDFWDKVGQVVGNLMELRMLSIHFVDDDDDDNYPARRPDWEILSRILRKLRHKILLSSATGEDNAVVEDIQALARTIYGHPLISAFSSEMEFSFANAGPWCSALATLPSLEKITLGLQEPETDDQRDLVNLIPLTELLRAPALRFVRFDTFCFTNLLCHATANALEKGSSIDSITFDDDCSFPDGGKATIANALKINASVTHVKFVDDCDEPFCHTLAAVLLCNSTLQHLTFRLPRGAYGRWLSSIFLSLGMNTTLKSLAVNIRDEFGNELCAAITSGLGMNSTLEELSLYDMVPSDDNGAVAARNALSFLRTNSTLKSLTVSFVRAQKAPYVSAFRLEALKMAQDNPLLESLTIANGNRIKFEELFALVSALHRDKTLKTLSFQSGIQVSDESLYLTDDKVNQMVSILKRNYGLEHLVPDIRCADDRNVTAILRLNSAGRRYLIEGGSSISKGVSVLSGVSDDINCVFLHLLENPSLCDR